MRVRTGLVAVSVLVGVPVLGPMHRAAADVGTCPSGSLVGMTLGDLVSCALPEPEEGPSLGASDGLSPARYQRTPGADYSPAHGQTPTPPAMAGDCAAPVRGTWTQDQGTITGVQQVGDRTLYEFVLGSRWTTGFGAGGRASFVGDLWLEPGGFFTGVGRELYVGTINGRTGSAVAWTEAHVFPSGRYVAHAYSLGGTEGLAKLRMDSDGQGFLGKGGHWEKPGRTCFAP